MAEVKTNAMRILDKAKIEYKVHRYEGQDKPVQGIMVAEKIGEVAEKVYKTLVAHQGTDYFVFVIPVAEELDLKKAAKAAGVKKIEMLPLKDLQAVTGYIRGGCSPVGMKKLLPTFIDILAERLDTMLVSAGKIGMQVELAPRELVSQISGQFAPLIRDAE